MEKQTNFCFISGLPIYENDPVYYIRLLKVFNPDITDPTPCQYWEPLFFPVKGLYTGEWSLKDIEEDDNTRHIEKHFNISIYEITSPQYYEIMRKRFSCVDSRVVLIHSKVYETLVFGYVNKKNKKKSFESTERFTNCSTYPQRTKGMAFDETDELDKTVYLDQLKTIKKVYFETIISGLLLERLFDMNMLHLSLIELNKIYQPTGYLVSEGNDYLCRELIKTMREIVTDHINK